MDEEYKVGDVHAPVEDVRVPFGLKLLVFIMFLLLVAGVAFMVLTFEELRALFLAF